MSSLNKVMIIGRLGKDPEIRYTQSQIPVATLTLATSETFVKDGVKKEETEWHKVVVWDKLAGNCQKYLTKGSMVYVEGKLKTRMWEKNGEKRYSTEIIGSTVQFLSTGNKGEKKDEIPPAPAYNFDEVPF